MYNPALIPTSAASALSPADAYTQWCSAAGVSSTSTLTNLDGDDEAYAFLLAAPFYPGSPGEGFYMTEGGIGLYETEPADSTIVDYGQDSIPGVNRVYGLGSRPSLFLIFHAANTDQVVHSTKLQKAGDATFIFAKQSPLGNTIISHYEVAIKITPGSIQFIGSTFDLPVDVLAVEWGVSAEGLEDSANVPYVARQVLHSQAASTTYAYTVQYANGVITAPSPTLVASITSAPIGSLNAALAAPSPTLAASAIGAGASFVGSPPKPTLAAFLGISAQLTAPSGDFLEASMAADNALSFEGSAPSPNLTATTGVVARLSSPSAALIAAGTVSGAISAALTAPSGALSAQGTVPNTLTAALAPKIGVIQAYTGAVAKLIAPSSPILSASVTAGGVMRVTVMAPLFKLTASATRRNNLGASLVAPMAYLRTGAVVNAAPPMAQLTAIGSAVVTVTYEAYALNLKHNADTPDELTRYTNFPFDRIVRYQNSYYGMNSTGLYLLEGTTDFAEPTPTPIPWSWKTAMTDFGTTQLQTIRYAYFGGRMAPAATIAIHFGDTASESYAYSTPRDASAQNYRQEFGRGIQSRYYAFSGQGGGELSLDSINFIIAKSARKV